MSHLNSQLSHSLLITPSPPNGLRCSQFGVFIKQDKYGLPPPLSFWPASSARAATETKAIKATAITTFPEQDPVVHPLLRREVSMVTLTSPSRRGSGRCLRDIIFFTRAPSSRGMRDSSAAGASFVGSHSHFPV